MITGLDHIAIAVSELEESVQRFIEDFQLALAGREDVEEALTSTAFFPFDSASIELVHPLRGEGPIAASLEKRGPGLHHICFRSDNLEEDVARLKSRGYRFLTDGPTRGAHGSRVIFIHPKSCGGVLVELSQPAGGGSHGG